MDISRKTDYALRMLAMLAEEPERLLSVRTAAEEVNVPYSFARSIQHGLVQAGIVESLRGVHGGMRLKVSPDDVTIRQVVEAVQGPMVMNDCTAPDGDCARMGTCCYHPLWAGAQALMRDPYIIWLSEVMLQQTQVPRVEARMPAWLDRFPTVRALAQAAPSDVLDAWQGMGYNRRALALHRAAQCVVEDWDGEFPREMHDLVALPGIGPATAQGIRSFAFDLPGVYLETNVRTIFLHHFFPDVPAVPDRELVPLIQAACPAAPGAVADEIAPFAVPQDDADTPRAWYYALLDYGAYLKKTLPNPSRRSASYSRQSKFEGSRRQKRAHIVRMLLAARDGRPAGITLAEAVAGVNEMEAAAGREPVERDLVAGILTDLEREGFCRVEGDRWLSV